MPNSSTGPLLHVRPVQPAPYGCPVEPVYEAANVEQPRDAGLVTRDRQLPIDDTTAAVVANHQSSAHLQQRLDSVTQQIQQRQAQQQQQPPPPPPVTMETVRHVGSPEMLAKLEEYRQSTADLRHQLDTLTQLMANNHIDSIDQLEKADEKEFNRLKELAAELKPLPMDGNHIGVTGIVSSGKSALVNDFTGRDDATMADWRIDNTDGLHKVNSALNRGDHTDAYKQALRQQERTMFRSVLMPSFTMMDTLELGQAFTCSLADTVARYNRMTGHHTLMLPAVSHGGVVQQAAVEKVLRGGDLTRDGLLDSVTQWRNSRLIPQVRSMGTSADWSRPVFTLSEQYSRSVAEAFIQLHKQGVITRETRHVNWSCALRTVVSQSDLDYIQLHQPTLLHIPGHTERVEFGVIYAVLYPLAPLDPKDTAFVLRDDGEVDGLVVWTSRPETILADVAVAVHSSDKRYSHLRGREVMHPLLPGRRLPIVVDDTLADPKAGNGVAKVAPGHEPTDLDCARLHGLPVLSVFADNGTIKQDAGAYEGLPRYVARRHVLHDLRRDGLLRGHQAHAMTLALCAHTGDVIELVLKDAWWMKCDELAGRVNEAVNRDELRLIPADYKPVMNVWLSSVQPWCISRQLSWGNNIPAYRITLNGQPINDRSTPGDSWVVASDEQAALRMARERMAGQCPPEAVGVAQDADVLDSWFTAAIHPLAALGWPEVGVADYRDFYPHSMVVAPHDQLFYWVARMAMVGLALTNQLPFAAVLLHPMVRDRSGRKMSPQLGNMLYPHDVIHGQSGAVLQQRINESRLSDADKQMAAADCHGGIPALGADALHMGLLASMAHTRDIHFDVQRIGAFRHFIAAMWQLSCSAFAHFQSAGFQRSSVHSLSSIVASKLSLPERWVLNGLSVAVSNTQQAMESFSFSAAAAVQYDFCLHQLCGTFFDLIQPSLPIAPLDVDRVSGSAKSYLSTLFVCLHTALRLLHPFTPLVTDELYARLRQFGVLHISGSDTAPSPGVDHSSAADSERVAMSAYPRPQEYMQLRDAAVDSDMQPVLAVARASSFVRSTFGLSDDIRAEVLISCTRAYYTNLTLNQHHIATLGKLHRVTVQLAGEDSSDWSSQPASVPPSDKLHQLRYHNVPKQRYPLLLSDDVKLLFEWQPSGAGDIDSDTAAEAAAVECMSSAYQTEQQLWEAEHHVSTIHELMDQPRYLQASPSKQRQWQHELSKLHRMRADFQQRRHIALRDMSPERRRRYAAYRLARMDSAMARIEREMQAIDDNQREQQQQQQQHSQSKPPTAASTACPASNVNGKQEIVSDSVKRRRLCMKLKWLRDRRVTAEAETGELHSPMEVQSM